MTAKKVASIWPINNQGAILVQRGEGTDAVANQLETEFVPSDPATSKIPLKFPADMPAITSGSGAPNNSDGYPDGSIYIQIGAGLYVKDGGSYVLSTGTV